jgi:hypothetical protein
MTVDPRALGLAGVQHPPQTPIATRSRALYLPLLPAVVTIRHSRTSARTETAIPTRRSGASIPTATAGTTS